MLRPDPRLNLRRTSLLSRMFNDHVRVPVGSIRTLKPGRKPSINSIGSSVGRVAARRFVERAGTRFGIITPEVPKSTQRRVSPSEVLGVKMYRWCRYHAGKIRHISYQKLSSGTLKSEEA